MKVVIILKKRIDILLLFVSLIIGLIIFDDYGISWDEPGSHEIGTLNYAYIFSGDKKLLTYPEKDYGVAFELPMVMIEKMAGLEDSRAIFLARHLMTHLFFLFSAFIFFRLIDFLYKNKVLATAGFLFIVLNPLLYAHSFFNSKDIPFMGMFIICFYLTAIAFNSKKLWHFILLGISTALLVNMRIIGVLPIVVIIFFMLIDILKNGDIGRKKNIILLVAFLFTSIATLYLSWPYLWPSPLHNFSLAIQHMSKFTWYGDVMFNGKMIRSTAIDWTYIPVWFSITTPIPYLLFGFFGIARLTFHFFKRPFYFFNNNPDRNNLLYIACFIAPVFAVILLKSVLYDSWRHLYFIYPSFILMGLYGLNYFYSHSKNTTRIVLFFMFGFPLAFMIRNHPFQQVYFNKFVNTTSPEHLRTEYELDYWGSSYKQSLEYILENDNSSTINVAVQNEPGFYNLIILKPEQRQRIHIADAEDAKYFITNYRWYPQGYPQYNGKEWHSFRVNNNSINSIFKLR